MERKAEKIRAIPAIPNAQRAHARTRARDPNGNEKNIAEVIAVGPTLRYRGSRVEWRVSELVLGRYQASE